MTIDLITNIYSNFENLLPNLGSRLEEARFAALSFSEEQIENFTSYLLVFRTMSSCYQLGTGFFMGLRTYWELRPQSNSLQALGNRPHHHLNFIESVCAFLHVPNLCDPSPGYNKWSSLYTLATRSINLIRTSSPPLPDSPLRQQIVLDTISNIAAIALLSIQTNIASEENTLAFYLSWTGTFVSGIEAIRIFHDFSNRIRGWSAQEIAALKLALEEDFPFEESFFL